jgi:hypothetical protein
MIYNTRDTSSSRAKSDALNPRQTDPKLLAREARFAAQAASS